MLFASVITCFSYEMDNGGGWNGMKWRIAPEIREEEMHDKDKKDHEGWKGKQRVKVLVMRHL